MAIIGTLDQLLHQARRRHSLNLVLEYLAVAGGIGAAGVILLLVLGRQILDWYWPVLLFVGALAAGLYRARKRMISGYRLAQLVDAKLGLEDRLSTVVYSRENNIGRDYIDIITRQAEERIHPGDAIRAVPFAFPKYGYVCAGLLSAAVGLVGVRYGVLHTMDLNPPIANIRFDPLQPEPKAYAATKKSAIQERWDQQLKELGLSPQDLEMPDEKGLKPIQEEIQASGNDPTAAAAEKQDGVKNMKAPAEEGGEPAEGGEKAEGDKGDNAAADGAAPDQKGQQSKKQNDAPQNAKSGQPGSQDGLMNKMRDALANLMNKMKNQNQQDQQEGQQGQQQQGQQAKQGQQQQQAQQSQGKQQGEGQPSADQEGQEQAGEKVAGDKSKSGDKNGDRPGDQNAKSGMGQQDGDKALREARQLEAMGKISEIFGKRAQQITGEMSVEVSSGKQQLKTQWSERKALHADTGAESNRNEIPLAYQSYIQRYFEEVRKTPGAKSKAPANP